MSLAGIFSGNVHHLRNTLGSSAAAKAFGFQAGENMRIVITSGRCMVRTITAAAFRRNQEQQESIIKNPTLKILRVKEYSAGGPNAEISKGHEFKNVQGYKIDSKTAEDKSSEWPAVVIVFDIETTGLGRNERIIEIAFRDLLGGKRSTLQTLVNPEKDVTNSHIHGILTHMVQQPGVPRMKDLIPIILNFVKSRRMSGKPVVFVAHNGRRFDFPFIMREFNRCGAEVPSDWLFVDTLPLARQLKGQDGKKLPSVKLVALQEYFRITSEGQAHRAMQDVIVLSLVLQKMSFELKLSVRGLMEHSFKASDLLKATSQEKDPVT